MNLWCALIISIYHAAKGFGVVLATITISADYPTHARQVSIVVRLSASVNACKPVEQSVIILCCNNVLCSVYVVVMVVV